jgi:hypothetical protein
MPPKVREVQQGDPWVPPAGRSRLQVASPVPRTFASCHPHAAARTVYVQ